jgi:hypothetical protein
VRVSLKSVSGIDSVNVSLEKGLASVKMKAGNTVTFKQVQQAITKNGFTMKSSEVIVKGKMLVTNGQPQLQVSGSGDLVSLIPDHLPGADVSGLANKTVAVEGILSEAGRGKAPDTIRFQSIKEDQ